MGIRLFTWEKVLKDPRPYIIKEKPHRQVLRIKQQEDLIYVKLFRPQRFRKRIPGCFGLSLAAHEYRLARALIAKQISTPLAIAYASVSGFSSSAYSIYVSLGIKDAVTLELA